MDTIKRGICLVSVRPSTRLTAAQEG